MENKSLGIGNFLWDKEKNELYIVTELPLKEDVLETLSYIEITEENLSKYLGFKRYTWYSADLIEVFVLDLPRFHATVRKEYTNHPNKNWYLHVDNEDFSTVAGVDVQYIHEIQNILILIQDK